MAKIQRQHRGVNPKELKRQAKTLGVWIHTIKSVDKDHTAAARSEIRDLEGIWNMLHTILDDMDVNQECILEDASIEGSKRG